MIKKTLIVTVGGSAEPVVEALKTYCESVDRVCFICSTGKGRASTEILVDGEGEVFPPAGRCRTCGSLIQPEPSSRRNIILQSGYCGDYVKVLLEDPDDFQEVFEKISGLIKREKESNAGIISDFTGGTKTMSSVLAMLSALDLDIGLSLTTGRRKDTEKVRGLSMSRILDLDRIRVESIFSQAEMLAGNYMYQPAGELILRLMSSGLSKDIMSEVEKRYLIARAFTLWDRFDYEGAWSILVNMPDACPEAFLYLLGILGKGRNTGYEKVFDLFSNADRQAHNGYYDNAIARIYRALEMFSQVRLKSEHGVDTSHLEKSIGLASHPDRWLSRKSENGQIAVGLKESYEFLLELSDPVGKVYSGMKEKLCGSLSFRNNSKLAHGDIPSDKKQWQEFSSFCREFIGKCSESIKLSPFYFQLPASLSSVKME
ncbi:MAG TPA: hypothetical protein PKN36_11185 [bacterium]|nr:hypothetical protein [bacterium]